jgi:hypothetical protein
MNEIARVGHDGARSVFTSTSSSNGGVECGQQDAEKEKQTYAAELPHNYSTELPASRSETLNLTV